jgi:hypothetical protein
MTGHETTTNLPVSFFSNGNQVQVCFLKPDLMSELSLINLQFVGLFPLEKFPGLISLENKVINISTQFANIYECRLSYPQILKGNLNLPCILLKVCNII